MKVESYMRVISGSARGRKLKEPGGSNIRPTSAKVKEAIFNIVQFDVEGRRALDLFAGCGQLGIEALSRGAAHVVFIDSSTDAVKLIRENLKTCGFSDKSAVYARDAIRSLESDDKFDLIFIDPPYESQLLDEALKKIVAFDKLNINGIIICESKIDSALSEMTLPYAVKKEYKYGNKKITKITKEENN